MRRFIGVVMALALLAVSVTPAAAQPKATLDKIGETGTLTIGTRTGSPPFAYVNARNEWVGFSVDLIAETMTDTRTRRDSVDFSLTFFVTGAQFLVKKGSPIKGIKNIDGKRIAAQQGSTNARIIREKAPKAILREFPDQPAAFQALAQGQVDAYTNDGIQLAGLKVKSPNPAQWDIVGDFYSYEPYGMAMRKGESDFRNVVNSGLMDGIESGKFFEIYDKWFGVKGELPYPMDARVRSFMLLQVVPK